jgi:ABC-2 type transport system permease protein
MIPLIKAELRGRKWSTIWWAIGIIAFLSLVILIYPSFRDQSAQLDASLQNIPDAARDLFTDTRDFLSPVGYLSSQAYYLLMPLLFSCLSIGLGASLIAREEKNSTIELLLARPLTRGQLLAGKAAAGLMVLLFVGLVSAIVATVEAALVKFSGVAATDVFLVTLMSLLMSMIFGGIAFMLTLFGRTGRGAAIGLAALIGLASYLFSSLDKTVDWLTWPAKVLPFHYYHPADILNGHFAVWTAVCYATVVIILCFIGYLGFRRRDIATS